LPLGPPITTLPLRVAEDKEREESGEDAVAFVVEQMKSGADEDAIVAMLQERGVERAEAQQLVGTVYPELMRAAEAEQFTPQALLPAVAGGLLAAIVGGAVWGLIVILTDYEVGFVAWGIGFLAGFLVVRFAGGRKGAPLQVIAIASSLVGIVLGKYIAYVYFIKEAVREQVSEEAADSIGYFDTEVMRAFREDFSNVFSGYDLLWAGLAIFTAWRMARPSGIRPRKSPISGM
jgi:uncharacterized integral membrane protein